MIYANNAGTSWPKPPEVARAVARAAAASPVDNAATYARAHGEICRFLGISDPSRLMLAPGCTAALALVVADLPWRSGDVVVCSHLEHHALARQLDRLGMDRQVSVEVAPYQAGIPIDLDFVRTTLRRGGVRLVAATTASNITGECLPTAELAALAHEYGALCLADAAQTVGMLPVDVSALGVDILTFAGHKGPLGPLGIGGFWAAPHVEFSSPFGSCEIGSPAAPPPSCGAFPGFCDVGSVNMPALAGLEAGIAWLGAEYGDDPLGGRPRALARQLIERVSEMEGVSVVGGVGDLERTATVSLVVDHLAVGDAEARFRAADIVVRAGQHCAPMALAALGLPTGVLRVSFGHHSVPEELEAIAAELARISMLR